MAIWIVAALATFADAALSQDLCGASVTPIHDVQGSAGESPMVGENVTVRGVVTVVLARAFFIQSPPGKEDSDLATAEGLEVFTGGAPTVAVGDLVTLSGDVQEFAQGDDELPRTQIAVPSTVEVCASGQELPKALVLGVDTDKPPLVDFADGIRFWESLENMRVTVPASLVVAGINRFDEYTVVPNGLRNRARNSRGGITLSAERGDFHPERVKVDTAVVGQGVAAEIGDLLKPITGVLSHSFGQYKVTLTENPVVAGRVGGPVIEGPTSLQSNSTDFVIGSYNVLNLPGSDDLGGPRTVQLAKDILKLGSPDVVALQEVQDNSGNRNDGVVDATEVLASITEALAAVGAGTYEAIDIAPVDGADGGIPGGNIRVALLWRPDRVELAASVSGEKGTATEAIEVVDDGGSARFSKNPGRFSLGAFEDSRKSLSAHFTLLTTGASFYVINNHFSSKSGSSPLFGTAQPPVNGGEEERTAQARAVRQFAEKIVCIDAGASVIALGDFNEFNALPPLQELRKGSLLQDLLPLRIPSKDVYTFNFRGNSQALDHIYVTLNLRPASKADILHVNSGVSEPRDVASDHDPVVAVIQKVEVPVKTPGSCSTRS